MDRTETRPDRQRRDELQARLEAFAAKLETLPDQLEDLIAEHLGRAPAPAPLLDVAGVAEWLAVSERTVERIVASGKLRPLWIEGQRRFTPAAVEAYLKACVKQPGAGRSGRRRAR